jgi:hypothetical protein
MSKKANNFGSEFEAEFSVTERPEGLEIGPAIVAACIYSFCEILYDLGCLNNDL